jgi:hypothetical protein
VTTGLCTRVTLSSRHALGLQQVGGDAFGDGEHAHARARRPSACRARRPRDLRSLHATSGATACWPHGRTAGVPTRDRVRDRRRQRHVAQRGDEGVRPFLPQVAHERRDRRRHRAALQVDHPHGRRHLGQVRPLGAGQHEVDAKLPRGEAGGEVDDHALGAAAAQVGEDHGHVQRAAGPDRRRCPPVRPRRGFRFAWFGRRSHHEPTVTAPPGRSRRRFTSASRSRGAAIGRRAADAAAAPAAARTRG